MQRRQFLGLVVPALTWPAIGLAQPAGATRRRLGVLMVDSGAQGQVRLAALVQALGQLGWSADRNIQIEVKWWERDEATARADELVQSRPDIIFCETTAGLVPLRRATQSIPIVFVGVSDPVGQGFVASLARPGGNATGFSNLDFSLIGKWLQLLKDTAPGIQRVGLMISSGNLSSPRWYQAFDTVGRTLAIEPIACPVSDRAGIENAMASLAQRGNAALIVPGDYLVNVSPVRERIVELAASHRIPALYGDQIFAPAGGLLVYAIELLDPYRRAAVYVDRILKGEKPAELPVQQPDKFRFVINLKAARALGLDPSPVVVGAADEVID